MKKIILIGTILTVSTMLHAEDITATVADIVKTKIQSDAEVAKIKAAKVASVSADRLDVDIKNKVKNGAIIGNAGLLAVGETVSLDDATIDIDNEVENGLIAGNAGVALGAVKD